MTITWLGHSAFLLEESTGAKVLTDPYSEEITGYSMPEVSADAVTVSHCHKDHDNVKKVTGEPVVIDTLGAFEIKGIHILSLKSFHDKNEGGDRGENLIFKFRADGVDVCHLGDIGEPVRAGLVEAIGTVNVLLVPVGGNFTIDAKEAKEYVDILMPDLVIPMHYKTRDSDLDIDKLEDFLALFEDDQIIYESGSTLELSRNHFDNENTRIIVLKKPEKA